MTLSPTQIETFKVALGMSNLVGSHDRAALIDAGDDITTSIVTTHESLTDHIAARRRQADETYEADGHTLHIWRGVQFAAKQPRCSVYFMSFGAVAAAMRA